MREAAVHILLIDQTLTRASVLEDGLREAGYPHVTVLSDTHGLLRRIVEQDPDVILIDLENPSRDVLEQMFQMSWCVHRPMAMFVDHPAGEMFQAAVEAGVAAYIADGLDHDRARAVLALAVSRFNAFSEQDEGFERARLAPGERTVIERATGILMREKGLAEPAAYAAMRNAAASAGKRVAEVARAVMTATELLR
jgi:response regulator NasT